MSKVRVFISSSLGELESEREIARETIYQLNMEPVMFESLPAMDKTLDLAYIDEVRKSHIFVLILWKDLTDAVESEYMAAIDSGIPMLLLVKNPTFRETRTSRLDKFLAGPAEQNLPVKTQYSPFRKKFRTLNELSRELKEGLMNLVSDRFTEPALTTTSVEVTARKTLQMVENARRRLLFVSKTPIILFGPRPYLSNHKNFLEESFHKAVTSWIEAMKKDESRRMIFLYSVKDTYEEMKKNNLEQIVKENLGKFKEIEEATQGRFELSSILEFPGRILVSDNSFGIQFRAPEDRVVCIFRQDSNIASNLMEVMCDYRGSCNKAISDMLMELKLHTSFDT